VHVNANNKLILLALGVALAAAVPACSSSDDDNTGVGGKGGGGSGGTEEPIDTGNEICDNGIDDDEDELVDCDDPNCGEVEACHIGCSAQVPDCEADRLGAINQVCIPVDGEGTCVPSGNVTTDGALERGSVMLYNQLAPALSTLSSRNKAYLLEFFHPVNPDGTQASCDALFEAGLLAGDVALGNSVGLAWGEIVVPETTVPTLAVDIPVPSAGQGLLVLTRFYSHRDVTGRPGGELFGIGCQVNVTFPAGEFVEDAEHTATVRIEPVCDPADENSCPGGKTCQVGALVCRDRRCGTECKTSENETCREVDLDGDGVAQPECLQMCDPAKLDIQPCKGDGERCDTTPGERPACIPS
jgi:hypothetical protein